MRLGGVAKWVGIALGVIVIAVVAFFAFFDWNLARGFISDRVSAQLGRPVAINGDLDVDILPWPPRVSARQVIIDNAPWGSRPRMAEFPKLSFRVHPLPLLFGRLVLPEIALDAPDVLLETGTEDRANWQFPGLAKGGGGEAPVIGRLTIDDGRLRFRDPQTGTDIRARMETRAPAERGAERQLVVDADGQYRGEPFSLKGRGGSILAFREPGKPYPLDVTARANRTEITVQGTVTHPARLGGLNIDLRLKGPDLQRLEPILRVNLPPTPAYRLEGKLEHAQRWWRLRDFEGAVGKSDLAGNFSLDFRGERPTVEADLLSRNLDMKDLSGFLGAPPGKGLLESAEKRKRVIPDNPFNIPELRAMDARVKLDARHVRGEGLPVDALFTHLRLEDGILSLSPLRFRMAGGSLNGDVRLNTRRTPTGWTIDMRAQNLDLGKMLPQVQGAKATSAHMGANLKLTARGNSMAQMLGSADGTAGFVVTEAEISKLLISAASLDIARTIASFLGDKDKIPLRCAVADFKVENGQLRPDFFVVDTKQANFYLTGAVSLGEEKLDLTMTPEPEGPTLSAHGPLQIRGSFLKPDVEVGKQALARGAAALALGALAAPLAALVPLVDAGKDEEHACGALIERVREGEKGEGNNK